MFSVVISQLLNIHRVSDVKQIEIHTAEPLVPDPSSFEIEIAIANMKRHNPPGSDEIPAQLIQTGDETLRSKIHKLFNSILNKEELPDQWKESIIVPVNKKGNKSDCNNYRGISLLSNSYKIVPNILSGLNPYIDEIIWDHQYEFRRNRTTTDQIFF
jgi:hypothetical protein